ncbi:glycosyltransferase family 2 protein [Rhizobium sp. LjRoot254]|uniref:glycosyltransferase family 2 protein n=1 Tax=Rhizobium sp. LjRoot254 TaxID=3342297 RepID=UPI003ECE4DC0
MVERARISVVIPVRNRPTVVHRALDSVMRQTVLPFEIVVVDDASTDNTVEGLLLRQNDPVKVHVIQKTSRQGASIARNAGINQTSGDLVAFLDSDDEWKPNKLMHQLALLEAYPHTVGCFCGIEYRSPAGTILSPPVSGLVSISSLQRGNVLGSSSTALVDRATLKKIGGFDGSLRSCQDWDVWLKLAKHGNLVTTAEHDLIYNFDGSHRISANADNLLSGHEEVFSRIYQDVEKSHVDELYAWHQIYLSSIILRELGDRWLSARVALRAFSRGSLRLRAEVLLRFTRAVIFGGVGLPSWLSGFVKMIKYKPDGVR